MSTAGVARNENERNSESFESPTTAQREHPFRIRLVGPVDGGEEWQASRHLQGSNDDAGSEACDTGDRGAHPDDLTLRRLALSDFRTMELPSEILTRLAEQEVKDDTFVPENLHCLADDIGRLQEQFPKFARYARNPRLWFAGRARGDAADGLRDEDRGHSGSAEAAFDPIVAERNLRRMQKLASRLLSFDVGDGEQDKADATHSYFAGNKSTPWTDRGLQWIRPNQRLHLMQEQAWLFSKGICLPFMERSTDVFPFVEDIDLADMQTKGSSGWGDLDIYVKQQLENAGTACRWSSEKHKVKISLHLVWPQLLVTRDMCRHIRQETLAYFRSHRGEPYLDEFRKMGNINRIIHVVTARDFQKLREACVFDVADSAIQSADDAGQYRCGVRAVRLPRKASFVLQNCVLRHGKVMEVEVNTYEDDQQPGDVYFERGWRVEVKMQRATEVQSAVGATATAASAARMEIHLEPEFWGDVFDDVIERSKQGLRPPFADKRTQMIPSKIWEGDLIKFADQFGYSSAPKNKNIQPNPKPAKRFLHRHQYLALTKQGVLNRLTPSWFRKRGDDGWKPFANALYEESRPVLPYAILNFDFNKSNKGAGREQSQRDRELLFDYESELWDPMIPDVLPKMQFQVGPDDAEVRNLRHFGTRRTNRGTDKLSGIPPGARSTLRIMTPVDVQNIVKWMINYIENSR
eukprot:g1640.t1